MLERHQDYVLRNITIPAGGSAQFSIKLDSDAPFALRTLAGSNMSAFQFVLQGLDDRSYVGGNGNPLAFFDSLLDPLTPANRVLSPSFFMFYPQITFPAQTTIQITLVDVTGGGTTGGVLVFRGTKLYPEGTVFGPQYPQTFSELNYRYTYNFTVPLGTAMVPSIVANQPLNIQSDADFVVRMAASFVQPGADGFVIGQNDVILRDQYGKAYSNDWVPTETLFPSPQPAGGGAIRGWSCPDVTIFPEIYLVRNTQLLLDIRRTGGTRNNTMAFVLHGSKIFPLS